MTPRSIGVRSRAFVASFLSLGLGLNLGACKAPTPSEPIAPASPQASAEPTPLATLPSSSPSALASPFATSDAGPPPLNVRGDRAVPADALPRDSFASVVASPSGPTAREPVGYTLQAVLHAGDIAVHQRFSESSLPGIDAAKKRLEPRMTVDLLGTRMRIVLGGAFVLPLDTELRARADLFGHVVVTPDATSYRVAAPGALRAVFGERRFDVAPLLSAEVWPRGDAPKRFSLRTRKVDVVTRAAKASFEVAHADGVGDAGALLCRTLLDLMNAPPTTPLCAIDEIPVRAELRWTARGSLTFEATALARHPDLTPQQLTTPPLTATFTDAPLPRVRADVLLFESELAALRTAPSEPPEPTTPLPPDVEGGLLLVNATDQLRFAWVDGLPIAWLGPGMRLRVPGLQHGRYTLQWRTFLGEIFDAPQPLTVPGVSQLGSTDGGPAL